MFAIEVDTCEVSSVSSDIKSLGHSNNCKKRKRKKENGNTFNIPYKFNEDR